MARMMSFPLRDPIQRSRTFGMTHPVRNEVVAAIAEFCGTFMFLVLAFAATQSILDVEAGRPSSAAQVLFIACAFGGALAANVWAFYRISGGMFNPAVRPPHPTYLVPLARGLE